VPPTRLLWTTCDNGSRGRRSDCSTACGCDSRAGRIDVHRRRKRGYAQRRRRLLDRRRRANGGVPASPRTHARRSAATRMSERTRPESTRTLIAAFWIFVWMRKATLWKTCFQSAAALGAARNQALSCAEGRAFGSVRHAPALRSKRVCCATSSLPAVAYSGTARWGTVSAARSAEP